MSRFFYVWGLTNTVLKAQLAVLTFSDTAAMWWEAHVRLCPFLQVTYPQLLECIQRELIPQALPSASHLAWRRLSFTSDIDSYIRDVSQLMTQHPIDPVAAHAIAAEPFGTECVNRVAILDDVAGRHGISLPHLVRQLRFAAESVPTSKKCGEGGQLKSKNWQLGCAAGMETKEGDANEKVTNAMTGHGVFRNLGVCWVCGRRGHKWENCR